FDTELVSFILKQKDIPKKHNHYIAYVYKNNLLTEISNTNYIYNLVAIIKEFAKYNMRITIYMPADNIFILRNYGVTHNEISKISDYNFANKLYDIIFGRTKDMLHDSLNKYLLSDLQNICLSYHVIESVKFSEICLS